MTSAPTEFEELSQLTRPVSRWRTVPVDALLLASLLGSANWFLGSDDPGWQRLNPTPWLLLPLFLGGRYGAGAGLIGAALATGAILGFQLLLGNMSPLAVFTTKPYFFLSLVAAGAAGTLVHHLVAGPSEKLRRMTIRLHDESARLREDSDLKNVQIEKMEETLLRHGAESISLPRELQHLLSSPPAQFESQLLKLLEKETGILSAAIYLGDSAPLSRVACTALGEDSFPTRLSAAEIPLADAALATGQTATWERDEAGKGHLAAIPWTQGLESGRSSAPVRALLLIDRMEFRSIRWEILSLMEAVFRWSLSRRPSEDADLSPLPSDLRSTPLLPRNQFQEHLEEAHTLCRKWSFPGQLVLFATTPGVPGTSLEEFGGALVSHPQTISPVGFLEDDPASPPTLGTILPSLTKELAAREIRQLLESMGPAAQGIRFHILGLEEANALANESTPDDPDPGTQSHAAAPALEDAPQAQDAAAPSEIHEPAD